MTSVRVPNGLDSVLLAELDPDLPGLLDNQAAANADLNNARLRHYNAALYFGNGQLRPSQFEKSFDRFDIARQAADVANADVADRITSQEFQTELWGRLERIERDMEQVLRRLGPPFDSADPEDREHAAHEVRHMARTKWRPLAEIAAWANHLSHVGELPAAVAELLRRCEGSEPLIPSSPIELPTSGVEWGDGQYTSPVGPAIGTFIREKQAALDTLIGLDPEPRNQRRVGFP